MSVYMTEDEQIELIKKWWQRYGNIITFALSIVLLCFGAHRYYQWHHNKISQQASGIYEKMMSEFSSQNTKAVRSFANELTTHYKQSIYSDCAHITLAKMYVSKNKYKEARNELQVVAENSTMDALKQIAKIRLARLLAEDKSYANALKELSVVEDKTYLPLVNELKGDIYAAKGQYPEAISAYRLAMNEVKNRGMGNLFLEMKTNETVFKKNQTKNTSSV